MRAAHLLNEDPNLMIHEAGGNKRFTFSMRMDLAPFDNNDVRLAVKYATGRVAMLTRLLRGHGYV